MNDVGIYRQLEGINLVQKELTRPIPAPGMCGDYILIFRDWWSMELFSRKR